MAFQTSTLPSNADASSSTNASPSSSDSGSGSDSGSNLNPNVDQGTGPLIPAFLLSGLLLVGIVILCWWRRRVPSSSVWGGNVAGGGTRYTVTVPPRTGVLGSAAWEVPLHAGDGRAARRELGPKPELWDAHLSVQGLGSTSESKPEWRNMKPVSAVSLEDNANGNVITNLPIATAQSQLSTARGLPWLRKAKKSRNSSPPVFDSKDEVLSPKKSNLCIAVVVSMPVPSKGHGVGLGHSGAEARTHSPVGQNDESLDKYDLMLGTSIAPCFLR